MKWYKHYNDELERPDMQFLLDKHGYAGIYAFERLKEILTRELDVDNPETFVLSKRYVFSNLFPKTSHKTGKKILDTFQNLGKLKYKIYGKEIIFNCSIIKELGDEYTQKVLSKRAKNKE